MPPRRYSKDKPRLGDTLEVIKFVCKDFWQSVFRKQVDNLKTNHRVGAARPMQGPVCVWLLHPQITRDCCSMH